MGQGSSGPRVVRSSFGRTVDRRSVDRFEIAGAGGMHVAVLTFGGVIQSVVVPDAAGRLADVVLGFDDLSSYERDGQFVGALIGRFANRIRDGVFTLDGQKHRLNTNDGPNHLHGGPRGFYKVVWEASPFTSGSDAGVELRYVSPHGEEGYPGRLDVAVRYVVTRENALIVDYRAVTDRPTPVNLTQHSYFNLAGRGSVLDHEIMIPASRYTPVDQSCIPSGELAPVAGTPLDFRSPMPIGARIDAEHDQLRIAGGYDHNYVLESGDSSLALAAHVREPASGRVLKVLTTEPGVQFYSGNSLEENTLGKAGRIFGPRAGFCLETQHFPDSPNQPHFPSTILRPGEVWESRTVYRFAAVSESGAAAP